MPTSAVLKTLLCLLALGLPSVDSLQAAELSTDFPKPPIPLELAPRVDRPFNDNAVFHQQMPIPVWGWSLPGAQVIVRFGDQTHPATAGEDGHWEVRLDPLPADKLKSVNDAPKGRTLTVATRLGGKVEQKSF